MVEQPRTPKAFGGTAFGVGCGLEPHPTHCLSPRLFFLGDQLTPSGLLIRTLPGTAEEFRSSEGQPIGGATNG
jgi:hypothetical protein